MRYTVNTPTDTGRYLGSVLTPPLARPAGAWNSRGRVVGQPGTLFIPAPPPAAVSQSHVGMMNSGVSRTSDSPNVILPSLYWEAEPGPNKERAPVSRISDNQMPVPALRPANVIVAKPYQNRIGGQRQVFQPQVVQRWLGMRGTSHG